MNPFVEMSKKKFLADLCSDL